MGPKFGLGGKADVDVDHPDLKVESKIPAVDIKKEKWLNELRKGAVELDHPRANVDIDVDIDGKANWEAKKHDKKFGVKMPKFGLGGKADVDVDHPDLKVDSKIPA